MHSSPTYCPPKRAESQESMPRVTQREQYKRHLFLRTIWTDPNQQACLTVLSPKEQRTLHAFYRPSETLTPRLFRDHLRAVQQGHSHLRHITGKLYRRVERAVAHHRQRPARQKRQARNRVSARRSGMIVAYGVVRPKPDLNKLLKALIQMAREKQDEDEKPKH